MTAFLLACRAPAPEPSPTADVPTHTEMVRDQQQVRHASDGQGVVTITGPAAVQVGAPVTFEVRLQAGPLGIAPGGAVTLTPSPFWGWSPPQVRVAGAPGFTTVQAPVALEATGHGGMVMVTLAAGLAPDDALVFTYAGVADRFAETAPAMWVGVDGDGDGVRSLVTSTHSVTVTPGPLDTVVVTVPSAAAPGTDVRIRVAGIDAVGNGFVGADTAFQLAGNPGLTFPSTATLGPNGVAEVAARVDTAGVFVVAVTLPDGTVARSNPLVARDGAVPVLWADLQIHSALSDGTGAPADVYRYAREVAGLDVAAITDHDHWGMQFLDQTPALREQIAAATESQGVAGRFLTVHGYEWTSWLHGHRHVLWFGEGYGPLWSSLDPASGTPAALHAKFAGQPAIVVRHHPAGGPVAIDWSFPVDPTLEPVVEVASVHGQSESQTLPGAIYKPIPSAFVDQQLARGQRFGLIGSTDGHDGHPGLSQLAPGGAGGLCALEGAVLTRQSVYDTLMARRVYATNGPRIVLRFSVDAHPMGTTLPAGPHQATVRVAGTAAIDHVAFVTRQGVVASRRGTGQPLLHATVDLDGRAGDLVYVRVVQVDGGIAWSSPVFFD